MAGFPTSAGLHGDDADIGIETEAPEPTNLTVAQPRQHSSNYDVAKIRLD